MVYHSRLCRVHAINAWELAHHNLAEAVVEFNRLNPNHGVSNVKNFIRRWVSNLEETGDLNTKSKKWKKIKLSNQVLANCVEQLASGGQGLYKDIGYSSINEAVRDNTYLKWVVSTKKVSLGYLIQCMKKYDPTLSQKQAKARPALTDAQKADRQEKATILAQKDDNYFKRVFWIDAKTMYMTPMRARYAWSNSKHQHLVIEDERFKPSRKVVKLNYYACVNQLKGAVAIVFVTGTTGLKSKYKVQLN